MMLSRRVRRRVSLLLPAPRRAALKAVFAQLRDEVIAELARAPNALAIRARLDASRETASVPLAFIGALLGEFAPMVLAQVLEEGIERTTAEHHLRDKRPSLVNRELADALTLYEGSARLLFGGDLTCVEVPIELEQQFRLAVIDTELLLVTVLMVLDGEVVRGSARGFRDLVGTLYEQMLLRYSLLREVRSYAALPAPVTSRDRLETVRIGERTELLIEPLRVDIVESEHGASAHLHALDLLGTGATAALAMESLRDNLACFWSEVVNREERLLTLDARAMRARALRCAGAHR